MSILERLSEKRESLTFQEMRIYSLLMEDPKKFSISSIGEIAQKLDISKTTLMRFAKTCDCSGYSDLKKQLQQEVLLTDSPADKVQAMIQQNYKLNMADLCKREQANIQESFERFNANDLQEAVRLIRCAKDLHTLSWGISGHLAEMFAVRTRLLGMRCTIIKRHLGTLIEETAHLHGGDVVVLFEFPPYSREVMETMQILFQRKVKIILVTDSERSPAIPYSTIWFTCVTDTLFFGNSFVAPLFWVNLVTSLVMDSDREKALMALNKKQAHFNNEQYYRHD